MKTKLKLILNVVIFATTLLSCEDFLEEEVISGVSYDYYENADGVEAGLAACYNSLRWAYFNEHLHPLQLLGTDTYREGQDGNIKPALNRYESSLNSQFGLFYDFWSNYYEGISKANVVISSIPEVEDMNDEIKNFRMGEARFLRGLYYFYLVQTFGEIPLVTELKFEVITEFPRSPVADVYNLIISDFKYATEVLPDVQDDYGRATKGAALHALALAYLTRGSAVDEDRGQEPTDMENAAKYADQVILSGNYSLVPDFENLWDINNQKNQEIIFAVQYSQNPLFNNDEGNWIHLFFTMVYDNKPGMTRSIEYGRPWRRVRPTDFTLYDLYDRKNDSRFYKTFRTVWNSNFEPNIPVWEATDGFEPSPDLLGQPKFAVGDTAIWTTIEQWPSNTNLDSLYASRSYYYVPRNRQTNAVFPQNFKFYDDQRPATNEVNGSRDWFLFRLGETYLIAAEAYGRLGEFEKSVQRLNELRKRAAYKNGELKPGEFWKIEGGSFDDRMASTEEEMLLTVDDITTGSDESFVDFILDERGRELNGELTRWWDLVRAGKFYERVKEYNPEATGIQPFHKLRPIPQNHIDRLRPQGTPSEQQNEGYY